MEPVPNTLERPHPSNNLHYRLRLQQLGGELKEIAYPTGGYTGYDHLAYTNFTTLPLRTAKAASSGTSVRSLPATSARSTMAHAVGGGNDNLYSIQGH
jgi:hypothetical protein